MKGLLSTSLVVAFVLSFASSAAAQKQPTRSAARSNGSVAVIDISKIFKSHKGFIASMDQMKGQVKAFEETLKAKAEQLKKMREAMSDFAAGSDEYKKREQEIARRQAQLQADTSLKQKEFLEAEAQLYHRTYNEITKEVARFCSREGFSLVLRYNSERMNSDDRASVLQGVNRTVVYQRNRNITNAILARLNGTPTGAARPRVSTSPRRKPTGAPR